MSIHEHMTVLCINYFIRINNNNTEVGRILFRRYCEINNKRTSLQK